MTSVRQPNLYDTPPRSNVSGRRVSGMATTFQSPYTPPLQSTTQRTQPGSIFSTPQRQIISATTTTTTPSSQSQQQQTPISQGQTQTSASQTTPATQGRAPETPKVGGKWIHPALAQIEREARKFMFGEEELKRLVANAALLISMWWVSRKIDESDLFEGVVRTIRHSPRLSLAMQLIVWSLRALFVFNIITAILPLIRPRSRPLTNIPLTPAQRELIGLDRTDITPIATTPNDTITPPRYKASPSGRSSPRPTPPRTESTRSVSLGTPSPAQRALTGSATSSFSTPIQQRPRSSSGLSSRRYASGVGGSPLGIGGSPLGSGSGLLESPTSRRASMEVFFRG